MLSRLLKLFKPNPETRKRRIAAAEEELGKLNAIIQGRDWSRMPSDEQGDVLNQAAVLRHRIQSMRSN